MKVGLRKNKRTATESEDAVHQWLKGVDLTTLASKHKFQRVSFSNLKPTNWDKLYEDFQKSRPISIRLPIRILDKLKQVSLQKGIGYQTLIRMWIAERLQSATGAPNN